MAIFPLQWEKSPGAPQRTCRRGRWRRVHAEALRAPPRACAGASAADTLGCLSDGPGVKGADGSVMRWLKLPEIAALEGASVVFGGMLPKLNACREALLHGVKRVRILPATSARLLPDLCSSRVDEGTEVMVA